MAWRVQTSMSLHDILLSVVLPHWACYEFITFMGEAFDGRISFLVPKNILTSAAAWKLPIRVADQQLPNKVESHALVV